MEAMVWAAEGGHSVGFEVCGDWGVVQVFLDIETVTQQTGSRAIESRCWAGKQSKAKCECICMCMCVVGLNWIECLVFVQLPKGDVCGQPLLFLLLDWEDENTKKQLKQQNNWKDDSKWMKKTETKTLHDGWLNASVFVTVNVMFTLTTLCIYTYIHTYIDTYIHPYIYRYTHTCINI